MTHNHIQNMPPIGSMSLASMTMGREAHVRLITTKMVICG